MTVADGSFQRAEATRLLHAIANLASEAGDRIMRFGKDDLAPRRKPDRSHLTAADEAAEEILHAGLQRLMPGIPVIAEEAVARGERPDPGSTFFLVDPVDATHELIAGSKEFAVNIGFVDNEAPTLGLIYAPALSEIFGGANGHAFRAQLRPGDRFDPASAETIRTRPWPGRPIGAISRANHDEKTEGFLISLRIRERLLLSSSLKFARIAEGKADVYARLAPLAEWDIAAGHALLAAAGGEVRNVDGTALRYGRHNADFRTNGFVAWGRPPAP